VAADLVVRVGYGKITCLFRQLDLRGYVEDRYINPFP
jgi:hypothetical protein